MSESAEKELLKKIVESETWEDVIYNIVSIEGLDPWDIDIVKLADSFLRYIESIKMLDFRIPAKIVFVAAILLKLKVETLFPKEKEEELFVPETEDDEINVLKEKLGQIKISPPLERIPLKPVTLDELIEALRKAIKVKERKDYRKHFLGKKIAKDIAATEEDIEKRIENLLKEIEDLCKILNKNKIEFSKIVDRWEREEIVKHFLPLLYLTQRGDVLAEQEEFFKEIWVSRKSSP
ncbi:MAG: segregation/condensation protein A [Candidatus Aenigmarchaeota archaeon]|nr:segregation/condensation protein A [Candidatus Aenigmarchaeota archaeon]